MTEPKWKCGAMMDSSPEPTDCNWPHCGCDKVASRVMEALAEEGWLNPDEAVWLQEDRARLDWLDTVNRNANERNGTVYGWKFDINHNRASLTDHNIPALSARDAIDRARK